MDIRYSELFHSIQGEGKFTGTPSVFFRTSFCNLRCGWCDTPYTSHLPENKLISISDAIIKICKYETEHVVITGGEPFVQKQSLEKLCEGLVSAGKFITIETNGTIYHPVKADLISCSPKTGNSTPAFHQVKKYHENLNFKKLKKIQRNHDYNRLQDEVLKTFIQNYDHQFKFVVSEPHDLYDIEDIVRQIKLHLSNVYLMPEGITKREIDEKQLWVAELCKDNGYNYSDRLHVRLWGNKRGV